MVYDRFITNTNKPSKSVTVKVMFENGDSITTGINTDLEGAKKYYLDKYFNLGTDRDNMQKAVEVIEIN